jgi:ribokinase
MKILNFGSLNLDYVYHVDNIVKAGETILSQRLDTYCGGKGLNQSVSIKRAGSQLFHAGKIGKDGGMLKKMLEDSGVNIEYILQSSQVTGHAVIQIDKNGQNSIVLYSGANYDIDRDFIDRVLMQFNLGDLLLLQNEISNVAVIMEKAHEKGMKIALNPSPINAKLFQYPLKYVDWFFLNEIEGYDLTGKNKPEEIVMELRNKYPQSAVVLTLGKKGVYYQDVECILKHGIYKVDKVDTTAAGDTFIGYFLAGIAQELEISEILRRASVASSIAISRAGAAQSIPKLEEVMQANLEPENSEL